jgi:hypothetical protein
MFVYKESRFNQLEISYYIKVKYGIIEKYAAGNGARA